MFSSDLPSNLQMEMKYLNSVERQNLETWAQIEGVREFHEGEKSFGSNEGHSQTSHLTISNAFEALNSLIKFFGVGRKAA